MKRLAARPAPSTKTLSVPSTRAYAMKPGGRGGSVSRDASFSTLNSGLRDETIRVLTMLCLTRSPFSTLNSGLRDETHFVTFYHTDPETFSTLNSGLRDETKRRPIQLVGHLHFQYPQLGPTR